MSTPNRAKQPQGQKPKAKGNPKPKKEKKPRNEQLAETQLKRLMDQSKNGGKVYRTSAGGRKGPKSTLENKMLREELKEIMEGITLPGTPYSTGFRVSSALEETTRTAAAAPNLKTKASFSTPEAGGSSTTFIAAFRSALRAFVVQYNTKSIITYAQDQSLVISSDDAVQFTAPLECTSTADPHGSVLYPGRLGKSDPHRGFWCDGPRASTSFPGTKISVAVATIPGASTLYCTVKKFAFNEWKQVSSVALTTAAPTTSFNVPESNYYSICFHADNNNAGYNVVVDVTLTTDDTLAPTGTSTPLYAQLTTPGLDDVIEAIDSIRVNAAAVELTQMASFAGNGGAAAQCQVKRQTAWIDYTSFEEVNLLTQSVPRPITNGAYSWLKPNGVEDFEWLDEWSPKSLSGDTAQGLSNVNDAAFQILPPSDYLVMSVEVPTGTNLSTANAIFQMFQNVEYLTQSQLIPIDYGKVGDEAFHLALKALSNAPQHASNEFHWDDILDWVKGAAQTTANAIIKYGPIVAEVLGTVAFLL